MTSRKVFTLPKMVLLLGILILIMSGTVFAKSVYLSANHHTAQFDAWNINPDGTTNFQSTSSLSYSTDPSGIGIDAITTNDEPIMFISSEFSAGVEIVNPVTLEYMGVSTGPSNLAGVDVDDKDDIVYALRRASNSLYIYQWDPIAKSMTQLALIYLPGLGSGYGIALDDSRDILWVGDTYTNTVMAYDVNVAAWTDIAEVPSMSFAAGHVPVDITVDSKRNIVYSAGGWLGSTNISKYEVDAGILTVHNLGYGAMGIAVDEITGYVYMTAGGLYGGGGPDNLQVWNCSASPFVLLQASQDLGNPAGLAVPNQGQVSFNPYNLAKNDEVQGFGVYIGQTFTYDLNFDNLDNTSDATGVMLVDNLPPELDFVSETADGVPGTGVYDAMARTVTWNIGTIPAGQAGPPVELVVQVNDNASANTTIYNYATIWSDQEDSTSVVGEDPDDPNEGPGTEIVPPPPSADLFGYVTSNSTALNGVYVTLYETGGADVMTAQTDEFGYYLMEEIPDGDYAVEVQVPLGFQPVTPVSVDFIMAGFDVQVDFELTETAIGKCRWNYWWWMTQFMIIEGTYPDPCRPAELTPAEIEEYSELVFQHFFARDDGFDIQIEGITYTDYPPRPLTYEELKEIFIGPFTWSFEYQAARHIRSLMLGVAAGCRSQLTVVTDDGATLSQALTYLVGLFQQGGRDNLITAIIYLQMMDVSRMIPAGIIPLDTDNIMYKKNVMPITINLEQNYPNPFNPNTNIAFSLDNGTDCRLDIHDILGRRVATLLNSYFAPGNYEIEWDGTNSEGYKVASGIYFYTITAGDYSETRKMSLMK